ncbi:hypothetical protein EGW08_004770 [Elysia chlorotica]|uniref:Uncharacterized protein n=1 Tax=Elysia chlorotica TaxID=188477 RepID=A0A3S1ABD2_ELYCH|nr:hypothetical protein EGW08_004770 [Elysia chlorotica]
MQYAMLHNQSSAVKYVHSLRKRLQLNELIFGTVKVKLKTTLHIVVRRNGVCLKLAVKQTHGDFFEILFPLNRSTSISMPYGEVGGPALSYLSHRCQKKREKSTTKNKNVKSVKIQTAYGRGNGNKYMSIYSCILASHYKLIMLC